MIGAFQVCLIHPAARFPRPEGVGENVVQAAVKARWVAGFQARLKPGKRWRRPSRRPPVAIEGVVRGEMLFTWVSVRAQVI